ncbi:hypothetical protein RZS08_49400, partial [Arthrospira platensis SPKY1]|nr:hypothetical protein [Arthrospira platensis SPKY1]
CLGLPRVWDEVIFESVVKRVSRDCVKLVVLGDEVEYYQGDVYVQDGDVDLVVGGWYLLDGDCDVEVEGDYARMFRFVVNGLEVGVYRFQRRHVLCRVDGSL